MSGQDDLMGKLRARVEEVRARSLVAALRRVGRPLDTDAADRIEALEAELAAARTAANVRLEAYVAQKTDTADAVARAERAEQKSAELAAVIAEALSAFPAMADRFDAGEPWDPLVAKEPLRDRLRWMWGPA